MRILLTGAAGYIGKNLLFRLNSLNHKVTAIIHHDPSVIVENVCYHQGDLTDRLFIHSLPSDIDVVIHCAALVKDFGPKQQFIDVNYKATKYLADYYNDCDIDQFIFLSHIDYEKNQTFNYYAQTKKMAESYLLNEYEQSSFPVTILRPGNVFGPGATIWVKKIIHAIQKKRIALIDDGQSTFFHTYIDNLLDAILLSIDNPKVIGETLNITDGDNSIVWKKYFSDLAIIINEQPPNKNISKHLAISVAYMMMIRYLLLKKDPWITPASVQLLTAEKEISIKKSKELLYYYPSVNYGTAMNNIKKWWNNKKSLL